MLVHLLLGLTSCLIQKLYLKLLNQTEPEICFFRYNYDVASCILLVSSSIHIPKEPEHNIHCHLYLLNHKITIGHTISESTDEIIIHNLCVLLVPKELLWSRIQEGGSRHCTYFK